jgi:hypothetical protein
MQTIKYVACLPNDHADVAECYYYWYGHLLYFFAELTDNISSLILLNLSFLHNLNLHSFEIILVAVLEQVLAK